MNIVKRISVIFLFFSLNSICLLPSSVASGECPIDRAGNQVQLCIGNTIEGGGSAGGGGPLRFGIRPMIEIFWGNN